MAVINEGLTLARDREVSWVVGRLTNSLGWLHQELGDFRRAAELDRESQQLGQAIKNPNVEVSALINVGWDHFHLGDTDKSLAVLEESLTRVEKFAFGAHRWRWGMHLAACLADVLLAQEQPAKGLVQAEKALALAQETGSQKYLGTAHLLRGRIAMAARDWGRAESDLRSALSVARKIEYPNLIWPAAHALATWPPGPRPSGPCAARTTRRTAWPFWPAKPSPRSASASPNRPWDARFSPGHLSRQALDDLERLRTI